MTEKPVKRAPKHLQIETRKWFRHVAIEWSLEEHHLRILTAACEAWDRCCQARAVIDDKGLTFEDRFGAPRSRPEIGIERDSRLAFLRAVRELDLDVEPPTQPTRPRALTSNKG